MIILAHFLSAYYVPGTVFKHLIWSNGFYPPNNPVEWVPLLFPVSQIKKLSQTGVKYWRANKVKGTEGQHKGKKSWKHFTESFGWIWIEPTRSSGTHARIYQFILNVLETKGFFIVGRGPPQCVYIHPTFTMSVLLTRANITRNMN